MRHSRSSGQFAIIVIMVVFSFIGLNPVSVNAQVSKETIDTLDQPELQNGHLYAGMKTGFPTVFGVRLEYNLNRDEDFMPRYLITGEAGLTYGFTGSLGCERRLWQSPIYLGGGYCLFYYSDKSTFHMLQLTLGGRSSYLKGNIVNFAFGGLLTPIDDRIRVLPLLHLAIVGN
jgi:hypothetical protein